MFSGDFVSFTLPSSPSSVGRENPASLSSGSDERSEAGINPLFNDWDEILDTPTALADMASMNNDVDSMSLEIPFPSFPDGPSQQFDLSLPDYLVDSRQGSDFTGFPDVFPALTGPEISPPSSFVPLDFGHLDQLFGPEPAYSQSGPLQSFLSSDPSESASTAGSPANSGDTTASVSPTSAWMHDFPYLPTPQDSPDATREPSPVVKVEENQEEEGASLSPPPPHPPARVRPRADKGVPTRARAQTRSTRFDPLNASGTHKCAHDGCPWRFPSKRMLQRHARTHETAGEGVKEYFCPNPACASNSPNVGKQWPGFSRGDALRRHLRLKAPGNVCVVMARAKGWKGRSGGRGEREEEMFRVPSGSTA